MLTGVNVVDCTAGATLLSKIPSCDILHGDKGYDSDAIRRQVEAGGAMPNIPPKANCKWKNCFSPFLYRNRNAIELFFRLMKQTLRFKRLMGRSQNAMRIQLAAALIAHLLLRLAQSIEKNNSGFLDLARHVKTNFMHRKSVVDMRAPPPRNYLDARQYEMLLC
jgi:transposase